MLLAKNEFLKALTERNEPSVTEKLSKATVGIAGCGGLGSNVAAALTRVGIGKLILVDSDKVELSNLNRQFFFTENIGEYKVDALCKNLFKINPYVIIEKKVARVSRKNLLELFECVDVLVEAFDGAEDKGMIVDAFLDEEKFRKKYLVCASGMAGFDSSNIIRTDKFADNVYIAGDFCSQSCEKGVMAPRVWIASAHEANMVVRLLAGEKKP
jgi:sulfur carrier protein ThiS adenylyltransferase